MKPASVRAKGQNAERDVCKLLQVAIDEVYSFNKLTEVPQLVRNLQQTQNGGHDVSGLPWISLEVKHHAKTGPAKFREWWDQTTRQAGDSMEPVLIYRSNGVPFRVRMFQCWMVGQASGKLLVDISIDDFLKWFRRRLHHEILTKIN